MIEKFENGKCYEHITGYQIQIKHTVVTTHNGSLIYVYENYAGIIMTMYDPQDLTDWKEMPQHDFNITRNLFKVMQSINPLISGMWNTKMRHELIVLLSQLIYKKSKIYNSILSCNDIHESIQVRKKERLRKDLEKIVKECVDKKQEFIRYPLELHIKSDEQSENIFPIMFGYIDDDDMKTALHFINNKLNQSVTLEKLIQIGDVSPDSDFSVLFTTLKSGHKPSKPKCFEIGKFYRHTTGEEISIIGKVDSTLYGTTLVAESNTYERFKAVGSDASSIDNWIEISKEEWMKNFS